jgi:succinoglycan biosynthesis transport protein ExoP
MPQPSTNWPVSSHPNGDFRAAVDDWPAQSPPSGPNPPRAPLNEHDPSEPPAIRRFLGIARRNRWLLLICFIAVPLAAFAYSLHQTKQYTATASLVFRSSGIESSLFNFTAPVNPNPQRETTTNLQLVSVQQVAERTVKTLDVPGLTAEDVLGSISVSPAGESELATVSATTDDPAFAARLANTVAKQYIVFSKQANEKKIETAQGLIEEKLASLPESEREGPAGEELEAKIRQLSALSAVQTGDAELAQAALPPSSPSSPKTTRNVALGIVLGLVLGIGLALLREQFDRRIRDIEDIQELFGVPLLGTIPESRVISNTAPGAELDSVGMEGEAFRMLRASLRYFNTDRDVKSILITSAASRDGKTTVAWNVALSEARAGKRVLYIEADLRRPTIAEHLDIKAERGLSLVLAGLDSPDHAYRHDAGLDVLAAGPLPPNPAELIEGRRMSDLLRWADEHYDRVVIDTPPAAVVADAVALFNQVDGVVIVARLRQSPRDAAEHLKDQLRNTGAPVLGIVVNGVPAPAESGYYRTASQTDRFAETVEAAEAAQAKDATQPESREADELAHPD